MKKILIIGFVLWLISALWGLADLWAQEIFLGDPLDLEITESTAVIKSDGTEAPFPIQQRFYTLQYSNNGQFNFVTGWNRKPSSEIPFGSSAAEVIIEPGIFTTEGLWTIRYRPERFVAANQVDKQWIPGAWSEVTVQVKAKNLPVVSSFSPTEGFAGDWILVSGQNLLNTTQVLISGKDAPTRNKSVSGFEFQIPEGAETSTFFVTAIDNSGQPRTLSSPSALVVKRNDIDPPKSAPIRIKNQ